MDMANMSYCRFQNTLIDFRDCVDNLEDIKDASEDEQRAAKKLYEKALEYVEIYESLEEDEE